MLWVYETDSIRSDNLPHARARFDLTFADGGRLQGAFIADPCAGVSSCSADPSSLVVLGSIATAFVLWRRRRAL